MNRFLCIIAATLLICGCGKPKDQPATNPAAAAPAAPDNHPFRVALVLPGQDNDGGWNQLASEGLDRIHKELGVEVKKATNVKGDQMARQAEDFADDGYDVVICHGFEFGKIITDLAPKYPKTHFIVGGFSDPVPGAVAVEFLAHDASYLVGVAGAEATAAKKLAFVGAEAIPPVQACYDGMQDGLNSARHDAVFLPPIWTNSWDSAPAAQKAAEAAISQGADVIYENVDASAGGVFQAVKDANKAGKLVYAFGCNRNQNDLAPDVILGSVVIDVPKAYLDLTREAKDGKWNPRVAHLGLKEGYVDLVLNESHPKVTPSLKAKVILARKALTQTGG